MQIILRKDGLRYFFSNEASPKEPKHVHVMGGGCDAKGWIEPDVALAESYGFSP